MGDERLMVKSSISVIQKVYMEFVKIPKVAHNDLSHTHGLDG